MCLSVTPCTLAPPLRTCSLGEFIPFISTVLRGGHTDPTSSSDPSAGAYVLPKTGFLSPFLFWCFHSTCLKIEPILTPFSAPFLFQSVFRSYDFFFFFGVPFRFILSFLVIDMPSPQPHCLLSGSLCVAGLASRAHRAGPSGIAERAHAAGPYRVLLCARAAVGTGAAAQAIVLPSGAHLVERGAASEPKN